MKHIDKLQTGQSGTEKNTLVRNQRIELRASPEEYEIIEKFATQNGYKTLAHYVRETALEGPPIQGTKKSKLLGRKKLISDLGRVGSNINQGLKIINQYLVESPVVDSGDLSATFIKINFLEMKEELKLIKQKLLGYSK